ncbi:hypothetical protein DACRYDRAFT_111228 [Dacryopinax primogenitus]|uniref:Sodium/calcium exchanger membrane region domain-containing protein n=1 Tax=Dacryopinax primogenitus (strain DJM 731) TaxID=1858805 RepID=M5FXM6_DACPD|nr:uncharacterized protein DACRYDRAFT_111228 [Dacryopinax primogenitus]EJT98256.1 hypothetical protein DACRYDRAFT_111228 [Dacryopinax primogenitus]
MAPSEFKPDAPLPGPPRPPPKPPAHSYPNVSWRPPPRTYNEEASIAERAYAAQTPAQVPPPVHQSRTMTAARKTYPYPGGRYTTPREEIQYAYFAPGAQPPPVPEKETFGESTHAAEAWRRSQADMREEGPGSGLRYLVVRTWLNALLLFVPIAWLGHFLNWDFKVVFALSFVAIVPLQIVLDFLGAQMKLHWGKTLGGLMAVTIGNGAPASLAVILLLRCELRLLQSVVAGVLLLQLLVLPGVALLASQAGGAPARLNQSLISLAVLSLLVLVAFYAATFGIALPATTAQVTTTQAEILQISRGMAIILIVVYLGSRLILPWIVSEDVSYEAPEREIREIYEEEEPIVPPWLCIFLVAIFLGVLIVTVLWLVDSFPFVTTEPFTLEWFGLILLPFLTFGSDVLIGLCYLFQRAILPMTDPLPPRPSGLAMDLSIQFALFWLPLVVLIGWGLGKPMSLLFDLYEVAILIGVMYLTNNSSLDAWTTPAEGLLLVAGYVMIGLCTWFYVGQPAIATLLTCAT